MGMHGTGCKMPKEIRGMKGNTWGKYGSVQSANGTQRNAREM